MAFANIYGHLRPIGMLEKSMAQKRVAHSYLFSGPEAVGKKTVALAFAQALICENHSACDKCPACLKMLHGTHPDIHVVETDAQFIRIDTIRGIQDQMTFRPLEGQKRIFIINGADKMNEPAANALLKTLEEPSADNILILITTRPFWLPQTIVSRCRHIRFNPLPTETIAGFLTKQRQMEHTKAHLLAALSGGSIGQALALDSEEMIAYRAELGRLLAAAGPDNPLASLTLSAFLGQDKKEIRQGLNILNTFFRDALVYKETGRASMVINADLLPVVSALAFGLRGEQILQNMALVEKSAEYVDMNVNKSLTLEAMAFKLHL